MKIKQRKNYIHLVVSGVPLFSTLETLQEEEWIREGGEEGVASGERFCLSQLFLFSTASAGPPRFVLG